MDLAFVRRRLRELRERQGLTQEQVADRAELSKNFAGALERGAKSFSMATFLSYVDAPGISPAEVFQSAADISELAAALAAEEQGLIGRWRALAGEDRRGVLEYLSYLADVNVESRRMA